MLQIQNVLGYLIIFVLVNACSRAEVREPLEIRTRPAVMPELILPDADPIQTRPVEWIIITEDNYEQVFQRLTNNRREPVLIGLTDQGYENLALNLNDLRTFIQQQNSIILAYRNFYVRSRAVINNSVVIE